MTDEGNLGKGVVWNTYLNADKHRYMSNVAIFEKNFLP
jgi:hypothetical protein